MVDVESHRVRTTLRPDEQFCIDAVAATFGGQWSEGDDPPDAYLDIGGETIAVEISTLTQYVLDQNGGYKPRLSGDSTAVRICDDLNDELKRNIPADRTVLLILSAPVISARKLRPRLKKEIKALVDRAGSDDVTVKLKILGNIITIHHIPEGRPSGKKVVGTVQNKNSSADILANATAILADRICVKGRKCKSLGSSGPLWLVLFNDYWLADVDTYKQALSKLSIEHVFERILIVSGDKSVATLYGKDTR